MAHNLNFKNGKASITYFGDQPWHKLGTKVEHVMTAEEAIAAAQLDYEVTKETLHLQNGKTVPDKFATVRNDTGTVLGVVGKVYRPLQNKEAFSFFDAIVGSKEAIYHTAGALGDGERIWLLAKLPKTIKVTKDDVVEEYILLTNSHDGSSAVQMMRTPIRVVCQNTLNSALYAWTKSDEKISLRHTTNIGNSIQEVRNALKISYNYFNLFEEVSKHLLSKQATSQIVDDLLTSLGLTQEKAQKSSRTADVREQIQVLYQKGRGNELPGVRGSCLALWNGVAEFADYHKAIRPSNGDIENKRIDSVLVGSAAKMKQTALDSLLALTK